MLVATKPLFEELVDAHSGELFGFLWRMLGDEAEAQDCLQDTFLRAYRAYGCVQNDNLRAWLYKIATNSARTQLKRTSARRTRNEPLIEEIASKDKAVHAQVAERLSIAEVKQAVQALPARQRAALMMRKYQELDYAEIAAALECSEDAARANVYQALKKLREVFRAEVQDE